ncbi:hypothetical protein V8F06_010110 [Rhypophila decipiens]
MNNAVVYSLFGLAMVAFYTVAAIVVYICIRDVRRPAADQPVQLESRGQQTVSDAYAFAASSGMRSQFLQIAEFRQDKTENRYISQLIEGIMMLYRVFRLSALSSY